MDSLGDSISAAIGFAVMLSVPAYLVLQGWVALKLEGGWRRAALAPLIFAIPILGWCAYAFADQSNLWPVPFILFAPLGTLYLLITLAASRKPRAA